ncbi:hypothetical protein [Lysobacter capsici]|uniref:hypothetical protein n=1 Tax=Lysobacter capsici TaxID=435897 RepID=UPI00287BA8B9|nr:hypothetical protein [Lysobacter capsici]WND79428.1 hypothetical protein RJ610_19305 [Lysobacter capsici]WND84624.1 hypothetical protein RJ609_19320 [Lysobacter capsici]
MNSPNTQVVQFQPAVENYGSRSLTAADVRAQVNLMQDVMQEVMKSDVHYGKIPGTNGKSLFKAGAEKLMATFRLAGDPEVETLGRDGEIHYRVKVRLSTASGQFVGAGIGECSSQEDKYAWRAAVNEKEFNATPENRRRIKYTRNNGDVKQVRTNPADVGNTILKMAKKRAQVDAVITCTAASDIFTQDIEDLPEEVVAELVGSTVPRASAAAAAAVQQTVAPDSPARDAALKEAEATARKGTAAFNAMWREWPRDQRLLVTDQMGRFKDLAEGADARAQDEAEAAQESE